MLLSDLLKALNSSSFLGIHEKTANGTNYEMIYTDQIKTKKEMKRVIKKYGKRIEVERL